MEKQCSMKGKSRQWSMAAAILAVVLIVPASVYSGHKTKLYVNKNAGEIQDGSKKHPFKTINQAMDKAGKHTEIHVSNGEYEENLTIKEGVELFGEDKDKTVIKAKKDKWSVVTMEDDSEINKLTLRGGERGIWVQSHAKVSIIDCIIKKNDKDGIGVEDSNTKKTNAVYISETVIKDNGKAGIYGIGQRRIVVVDSEIFENEGDGIVLGKGTSAWIAGNSLKDNKGSGLVLTIDRSDIYTEKNSIRRNKREGIEVSFAGLPGRVDISKTKLFENGRWGAAKAQRASFADSANLWNRNLTFGSKNEFAGNGFGNISGIVWAP